MNLAIDFRVDYESGWVKISSRMGIFGWRDVPSGGNIRLEGCPFGWEYPVGGKPARVRISDPRDARSSANIRSEGCTFGWGYLVGLDGWELVVTWQAVVIIKRIFISKSFRRLMAYSGIYKCELNSPSHLYISEEDVRRPKLGNKDLCKNLFSKTKPNKLPEISRITKKLSNIAKSLLNRHQLPDSFVLIIQRLRSLLNDSLIFIVSPWTNTRLCESLAASKALSKEASHILDLG
ncbi:hypothetical protein ACOME3_004542 [Neoechinorhynchus agilis]